MAATDRARRRRPAVGLIGLGGLACAGLAGAAARRVARFRPDPSEVPPADLSAVDGEAAAARLAVAGGTIRTIAINAAFLAAEAGEAVNLGHLAAAARREYAKLDKPITTAEFGGLT